MKKNLATINELRSENHKLVDEKRKFEAFIKSMERKFGELHERVIRLEDSTKLLMNGDASNGGNVDGEPQADSGVLAFEVKDKDVCENALEMILGTLLPYKEMKIPASLLVLAL
ncbi:hypothetical protein SESBI_06448 [Sesbania bispinosa]|nr:hypothetical protein SESBI_06448 [Sesbania bispinosa]